MLVLLALAATVATFALQVTGADHVVVFVASAVALAALAALVGEGTEQLGHRFGAGATGVLQSALGNLPELFISIFALQAGLVVVVQTALIGSILANTLLVLGLAFIAGGLRNGVQRFTRERPRLIATLLLLAVAALAIPTLATAPGAPDQGHATDLSVFTSIVLLVVFAGSIPFSIGGEDAAEPADDLEASDVWPLSLSIGLLAVSAGAAALVSDWFVEALRPAMASLGLSEAFVGLVIVAIAGNAVEHVVGIQMAYRNRADLAISVVLNGSLQVALALIPVLVIVSLLAPAPLTLVLSPLLVAAVALSAVLAAVIVFDGESNWLEGLALVGLYLIIAASVWFGAPVKA